MNVISGIFSVALVLTIIFVFLLLYKNDITYKHHIRLIDAIFEYQNNNNFTTDISYDQIEDYGRSLFRLWDWGYKNIVSKDVYKKIEKYIKLK